MKEQCKQAITMSLWASRTLPEMFSFEDLIGKVCDNYGTEFTADCMLEMGLKNN